jgi:hypothetical protein
MNDSLFPRVELAISIVGFYAFAQLALSWTNVRLGALGHFLVLLASVAFGFVSPLVFPDPGAFGIGLFCLAASIAGLRELLSASRGAMAGWEVGAPVVFLVLVFVFGGAFQIIQGFYGGFGPHDRRTDRQQSALLQLGKALEAYRSNYAREWPPTLSVLAREGYAEPFAGRDWKGQDVVYDQPPANSRAMRVVAYSWPPYKGIAVVLRSVGSVETVRVGEEGRLIDPDTGELIHAGFVIDRRKK